MYPSKMTSIPKWIGIIFIPSFIILCSIYYLIVGDVIHASVILVTNNQDSGQGSLR